MKSASLSGKRPLVNLKIGQSLNPLLHHGYQSERVTHKSELSAGVPCCKDAGSELLTGIHQTLRNFNTITHELEKINEHIGHLHQPLDNYRQRKASTGSQGVKKASKNDKGYKRGPLFNIQNIQTTTSTLDNLDFPVDLHIPQSTKSRTGKESHTSLQPKQKKKGVSTKRQKKAADPAHCECLPISIKESELLKNALLEEKVKTLQQNKTFTYQKTIPLIFEQDVNMTTLPYSRAVGLQAYQTANEQSYRRLEQERNMSKDEIRKIHERSQKIIREALHNKENIPKPVNHVPAPSRVQEYKPKDFQCESRCSNVHMCAIKKNNNQIDAILEKYQTLCHELDSEMLGLAHQLPLQKSGKTSFQSQKQQMDDTCSQEPSDLYVCNYNTQQPISKLELLKLEMGQQDQYAKPQPLDDQTQKLRSVVGSISERSLSLDSIGEQYQEFNKDDEEDCFLVAQQENNDLPYQDSINSYNTADFTKFSIAELSQSQEGKLRSTEARASQARTALLEEGFSYMLRIVLKLSKQFKGQEALDYSFFDQISELPSLESLVDLLKFINSDKDVKLVKSPKIQDILKKAFPLIRRPGSIKVVAQEKAQEPMKSQYRREKPGMASPLTPQVNLVSSAITPIKILENHHHHHQMFPTLDTINLVGIGKTVTQMDQDAQLTLRNHEIFEEQEYQRQRDSNLFSHATSQYSTGGAELPPQRNHYEGNVFEMCEDQMNTSHIKVIQSNTPENINSRSRRQDGDYSPVVINRVSQISLNNQTPQESEKDSEDFHSSQACSSLSQQDLDEILFNSARDTQQQQEQWRSQQMNKLNFSNVEAKKNQVLNQRRINYSQQQEELKDEFSYSEDEDEDTHRSSQRHCMVSQISYSHAVQEGKQRSTSSTENESEKEDGRIMAYLEHVESARHKQAIQPSGQVNKSLNSIELAVNKFLGGFTTLKTEISQLKDTVLANPSTELI